MPEATTLRPALALLVELHKVLDADRASAARCAGRIVELEQTLEAVAREFRRHGNGFPDGFDSRVFRWVDDALACRAPFDSDSSRGAPGPLELVRQLREALGLSTAAQARSPAAVWQEAIDAAAALRARVLFLESTIG